MLFRSKLNPFVVVNNLICQLYSVQVLPRPQHSTVSPLARTQAVLADRHRQQKLSSTAKVKVTHMTTSSLKLPSARKRPKVKLAAPTLPSSTVNNQFQSSNSTSSPNLLTEYNLRHFGIPADGPSSLTGKFVRSSSPSSPSLYNALLGISEGSSIPSWRLRLPSHAALRRTPFGLPSLNHSFTQEASFDTIIFSVFKYGVGFLTESDFDDLCSVNVLLHHLATMIVALNEVDFRALRDPDPNWSLCQSIPRLKELDFLALLFHYDLHLSAAVRFLGSKYLGGHRNIPQICAKLAPHVDAETIAHYKRIMTVGCPNRFTASTTRANSELYRLQGNDSSILRHQSLVQKNMLKEYKHNFAFPLPNWMARYLRHTFFTPQHIHLHPSKPPRQIFNAKERPTPDAVAVNNMTSTPFGSELECRYGDVLPRLFRRLWNLRITYPNRDIVFHCNDVKSCFRQIKHHPDVVGAFSFVVFQHVWVQIGCTFGSDFSPANWEGIRRTIEQLARGLFDDASLRTKHRKYLDQLKWDVSLDSSKAKYFVPAMADSQNNGVLGDNGRPVNTPYDMFVDDLVYAEVYLRQRVEQAIAASIEAMFITLGESDLLRMQDPVSWDKLVEMIISHFNKVLGVEINTRRMDVGPPPEFVARTLKQLEAFHSGRRAFTVKEMSTVVGLLGHIATTSKWLNHLLSHLYTSIASALKVNRAYEIQTSKAFRDAMKALDNDEFVAPNERSYHQGVLHRLVHKSRKIHYLNSTAKEELRLIRLALMDPTISLRTPIAHLVPRDPSGKAWGDSSLDAAGGFSIDCRFWWYLEWSEDIRRRTLRYRRNNSDGKFISINALEFASVIINFAAMTLFFQQNQDPSNPFPVGLIFADNVSAEIWAIKGCKSSLLGRALGRLLCALLINNPLGLCTARISTSENKIADEISRLKAEKDSLDFFSSLVQSHPQLHGCRRFHPSKELLSGITEVLLTGKLADPLALNKTILANPGSFTS